MKTVKIKHKIRLKINKTTIGEDLVTMLRKRTDTTDNFEGNSKPLLYNERKDGVIKEGNPKTDKWDIMQDAEEMIARTKLAQRDRYDAQKAEKEKNKNNSLTAATAE